MSWEFARIITIGLGIVAIIQLLLFYRRTHEPGVFAPISWILLVIGYDIFKLVVQNDLKFYIASLIWVNIIYIVGIIMIIAGGFIFRDIKRWTFHR